MSGARPGQDPTAVGVALKELLGLGQPADVTVRPTSRGVQLATGEPAVQTVKVAFVEIMGDPPRELPNGATVPILCPDPRRHG
jgi:hypothetical protein